MLKLKQQSHLLLLHHFFSFLITLVHSFFEVDVLSGVSLFSSFLRLEEGVDAASLGSLTCSKSGAYMSKSL